MIRVAVHTLVMEPIWKIESVVAGYPVTASSTPVAAVTVLSPNRTAMLAPGMFA